MIARASIAFALVGLVGFATSARAQSVPQRRVGVHWADDAPRVDFSAVDFVDAAVRARLESGLRHTIVTQIVAYRADGTTITAWARSCEVAYDLWERSYRVHVQDVRGERAGAGLGLPDVLERCLVARRAEIGAASDYAASRGERIYFGVLVELNPLSPDTVQRIRRWLARPAGGGRIGGEAFYGSFVSLFVNRRIGDAERARRFRSQIVSVP